MTSRDLLDRTIVLVEDRRFYRHHGVDLIATLRAFVVNLRDRRYSQGGSTITQQLARTLYLTPRKTLLRKFLELVHAFHLEWRHSKEEILRMYVTSVYMGKPAIRGFSQACRFYFGKSLRNATVAEVAALVGMLKGPNLYRPGTERFLARTLHVLCQMMDAGLITREELLTSFAALDRPRRTRTYCAAPHSYCGHQLPDCDLRTEEE